MVDPTCRFDLHTQRIKLYSAALQNEFFLKFRLSPVKERQAFRVQHLE